MAKPQTWYNQYSRLTEAQYAAIGRIASHWSIVEFAIENIIIRLAGAPDFPGLALTNNLAADNRATALKRLIDIHTLRYHYTRVDRQTLSDLKNAANAFVLLKSRRNRIIHDVWWRHTDEKMFSHRFQARVPDDFRKRQKGETAFAPSGERSVTQVNSLGREIEEFADHLWSLVALLPAVEEEALLRKSP